jgi:hypothetical protein
MKDCDNEIRKFHSEAVKLDEDMRKKLRGHALANEDRLEKGLQKQNKPTPEWFSIQGSYAMRTTVQHPDNDYDIDNGAVFSRAALKGSQGTDKTALAARQMVCDALLADPLNNFSRDPEVRTNCVRVYYKDGYQVDMPVYRVEDPNSESKVYELASVEWKTSSPEGVTDWFNDEVKRKRHSDEASDKSQFRRMVRLLKKFAISRKHWNMPSGFILTVLTVENFTYQSRDDEAFYNLLCATRNRVNGWNGLVVKHPVLVGENITKASEDACMIEFKDRVQWAIDQLAVLFEDGCSKKSALKAWKSVFNVDFFDEMIEESGTAKAFGILTSEPKSPVQKEGGGRFG